jgi:zinc protease
MSPAKLSSRDHVLRGAADGVRYLLEEAPGVPLVSMTLAFRTGSLADPPGKAGLTRVLLRLMRRGTGALSQRAVDERIDALGGDLSVDVAFSSSAFHGQVIARNLDAFVELTTQLATAPSLPQDEFERLIRESLAELVDAQDSDRALASEAFRRELYATHPYGRSSLGTRASLTQLTRDDLVTAHRALLTRSNLLLGFSGAITESQALTLTTKVAQAVPAGAADVLVLAEPTQPPGRHLVFVDKPDRSQTQVIMGRLGTRTDDPDHVALGVANAAFGGTFTARLMKEVRSKRGWSYGASSRLAVDRARQSFSMWTFPAATQVADCIELELKLLAEWHDKGLSARELASVKNYLVRSYAFEVDSAQKRLGQALDEELLSLPNDYYASYCKNVAAVTLEECNASIRNRLNPSALIVSVVGTATEVLAPIAAKIGKLDSTKTILFSDL